MLHTKTFALQGLQGQPIEGVDVRVFDPDSKTQVWSSKTAANGKSDPMPERQGADQYAAVIGFEKSIFHFYDTNSVALEEEHDDRFEDEHHDRTGE